MVNQKIQKHMVIYLLAKGYNHTEIAHVLDVSRIQIGRIVKEFRNMDIHEFKSLLQAFHEVTFDGES